MNKRTTIICRIFAAVCLITATVQTTSAQVNNTQKAAKSYIIHTLQPQETYYQLSRLYKVSVDDIMNANNKKNLRAGDTVRIPSNDAVQSTPTPDTNKTTVLEETSTPTPQPTKQQGVLTEYLIGENETLYSIAKRFQVTVDQIKALNNLNSDNLRAGQKVKIPDGNTPAVDATPTAQMPVSSNITLSPPKEKNANVSAEDFKANRYGIRETAEKGIAVWMDNLETKNNSNLALHRTAPVGTILKITNPITKSVTYAKVVGKFAENADTSQAIVVLSKSAAAYIGARDKRFLVEINYGLPLE